MGKMTEGRATGGEEKLPGEAITGVGGGERKVLSVEGNFERQLEEKKSPPFFFSFFFFLFFTISILQFVNVGSRDPKKMEGQPPPSL